MAAELQTGLDADEREFLLSLARNEPNWALLDVEHLEQLPAMRWKHRNLEQLAKANPKKLMTQAQELEGLLSGATAQGTARPAPARNRPGGRGGAPRPAR